VCFWTLDLLVAVLVDAHALAFTDIRLPLSDGFRTTSHYLVFTGLPLAGVYGVHPESAANIKCTTP
jgi:hypothetical protein